MPHCPIMNDFYSLRDLHKSLTKLIEESKDNPELQEILDEPVYYNGTSCKYISNIRLTPNGLSIVTSYPEV